MRIGATLTNRCPEMGTERSQMALPSGAGD
jgi:hypothetical protein